MAIMAAFPRRVRATLFHAVQECLENLGRFRAEDNFMLQAFSEFVDKASLLGLILLEFALCADSFLENRRRNSPFNMSNIERAFFSSKYAIFGCFANILLIIANFWSIAYAIGYMGFWRGIIIYIATMCPVALTAIIIGSSGFGGIILVLIPPALIAGLILTLSTNPF
jgi:hypothetical protein